MPNVDPDPSMYFVKLNEPEILGVIIAAYPVSPGDIDPVALTATPKETDPGESYALNLVITSASTNFIGVSSSAVSHVKKSLVV